MRLVRALSSLAPLALIASVAAGAAATEAERSASRPERQKVEGYAEYRQGPVLIVDGQRIVAAPSVRVSGRGIKDVRSIPLGYEVKAEGTRAADGTIVATKIEAKPNGQSMFEPEVRASSDEVERLWVERGAMVEPLGRGRVAKIGDILEDGPYVERARRIMDRLRPAYIRPEALRVRVVQTKEWNASAMGNGAIWVFTGLMDAMSDDELAIVLGHELAHFTHEHSRRQAKKAMWAQIFGVGAMAAANEIGSSAGRDAAAIGAALGLSAFTSGYSRDLEDQADRVGLRYVHEAGYDVRQGPRLWAKFREKYGEQDKVTTFFVGSHSRPSDRIRNIERELALNYPDSQR